MKLLKTANGNKIKISKKEWQDIGKTAGWRENGEYSWTSDVADSAKDLFKGSQPLVVVDKFFADCMEQINHEIENNPDQFTEEDRQKVIWSIENARERIKNPESLKELINLIKRERGVVPRAFQVDKQPLTILNRF